MGMLWPRTSLSCTISLERGTAEALKIGRSSTGLGVFCHDSTGLSGDSSTATALTAFSQQCLLTWRTIVLSHFSLGTSVTPRGSSRESRGEASADWLTPDWL